MFTDCHCPTGATSNPELDRLLQAINYLTWKLDIKFTINLGDTVNNPNETGSMAVYPYIVNALSNTNSHYVQLVGNHDYIPVVYRRNYATNLPGAQFDNYGEWFYMDDDKHGVRFVYLESQDRGNDAINWTTLTTNTASVCDRTWLQLNWLANTALKTTKKVIIFGHQALGTTQSNCSMGGASNVNYFLAKDIVSAFIAGESGTINYTPTYTETKAKSTIEYDFTDQGAGRLLCAFNGHTHGDLDWTYSGLESYPTPFDEIWTDDALYHTQTYFGKNNTKTANTHTEIAFDVVTVDLINEKVYCTRFGAGDDRELTLRKPVDSGKYTRVNYIQSSGTQYIDTGYVIQNSNHKFEVTFCDVSQGSAYPSWIFGSYTGTDRTGGLGLQSGGRLGIAVGSAQVGSTTTTIANPSVPTTVIVETTASTFTVLGGDKQYIDHSYEGTCVSGQNEEIFRAHYGSGNFSSSAKVYGYKLWDNGTLVRDMIPVLDENGEACMYDLVEHKFYRNTGTGSFTYGAIFDGELEDGTIDGSTGNNMTHQYRLRSKNYSTVSGNTTYTLYASGTNIETTRIAEYRSDGTYIGMTEGFVSLPHTFTTNANTGKIRFILNSSAGNITLNVDDCYNVYIEEKVTYPDPDVTFLEYIQSSGNQYVDTEYVASANHKTSITLSDVVVDSNKWLYGSYAPSDGRSGLLAIQSSGKLSVGVGSTGTASQTFVVDNPSSVTTLNVETTDTNKMSLTGGSQDYINESFSGTAYCGVSEAIFAGNVKNTGMAYYSSYKLHEYKLYDNGLLVRDMVPVTADSVNCLYDKVNNRYYFNKGTGTFTAGPAITE